MMVYTAMTQQIRETESEISQQILFNQIRCQVRSIQGKKWSGYDEVDVEFYTDTIGGE